MIPKWRVFAPSRIPHCSGGGVEGWGIIVPFYSVQDCSLQLRVRFFKKIQVWILESEKIRKRILRFFTKRINPRCLGSWCVKGTEESITTSTTDLKIQSWIFLKKRILRLSF